MLEAHPLVPLEAVLPALAFQQQRNTTKNIRARMGYTVYTRLATHLVCVVLNVCVKLCGWGACGGGGACGPAVILILLHK